MTKKKKISIIVGLALLICTMMLSPLSSYAAMVDENGLPDIDRWKPFKGEYFVGSSGLKIYKGDTEGSLFHSSLLFDPMALDHDSAWCSSVRISPFSTLDKPDYSIKLFIQAVYNNLPTNAVEFHIGVNEGYTSISITHYSYNDDGDVNEVTNVHNDTLTDFKPLICDIGLYWYDDPCYVPEFRIDGHNLAGQIQSTYYSPYRLDLDTSVPVEGQVSFTANVTNGPVDDPLLVSYAPSEECILDKTPTALATQAKAINTQLSSFFYEFGTSGSADFDELLQSKYEEGFSAGISSSQDYYEDLIESERDHAYQNGYDKGVSDSAKEGTYAEGFQAGRDKGFLEGQAASDALVKSVDKIGDILFKSVNTFSKSSDTIFGVNLMQIICTFTALGILWAYIRKVF